MSDVEAVPARQLPRPLRIVARFLRRTWQWLLVCLLALGLGVAAYLSPGLVQADVRLDEGTVFAVKRDSDLVGTLNAQIDELSNASVAGDSQLEVLQHEDLVLVHLPQSSRLTQFNPGRNTLGSLTQLPSNARIQLVGDKLLVYTPENGRLWFGTAESLLSYDFQKEKADLEIGENGIATLTTDGDVIGLDPNRSLLVREGPEGPETTELPFALDPDVVNVELSAVGDKAVVLDRTSGRIWVEGMSKAFDVSGASGAQLTAPAPDALGGDDGARAIYATQAGLIALTGDGPRSLTGQLDASPVAPVQVGRCVYGAFRGGDAVRFARACVGQETHLEELPSLTSDGEALAFQVNRTTVTLNDLSNGTIWMVDKGVVIHPSDWEEVAPVKEDEETELQRDDTNVLPDRDEPNRAPVAEDDQLSARAGRWTVLDVLDNDTDPDGDVLTIAAPTELDGAQLAPIRGGAGLQVYLSPEHSGSVTFQYTISDGRGGTDSAEVTLRSLDPDPAKQNSAPYKFGLAQPLKVQLGQKAITKRVLLDWRDPDGDPLMLKSAVMDPAHEDLVDFTPDGQVTYRDVGKTKGTKTIQVVVSDGVTDTDGELVVEVSEEPIAPVAYGDYATTTVGSSVTVEPLANDLGAPLTMSEALPPTDCPECTLQANYRDRSITFSAPKPGSYYVPYTVTNGQLATGLVRIDVAAEGSNRAPIAAQDVALLPPGGTVMVDPLLNDTDADGDVLVIQTYEHAPSLEVVMERRHMLTIKARTAPDGPMNISYRVSDGKHSVTGTIVVIPTDAVGVVRPRAEDDEVSIRAGASVTVDALVNDTSPIGLELKLAELTENPFGDRAWIDGDRIRISVPAGSQAGTSTLSYTVVDSEGNVGTARVVVTQVSEDAPNVAPEPRQVVDRVLAGTTTRIPIELSGIDPNGDAVRLVGLGSGPTLGRVMSIGEEYLTYEAFANSRGTDTFHYDVVDSFGVRGRGEVRIGVASPSNTNAPPVGVLDEVEVRPGRQVQLAAIANDFDADGDLIDYASSDPVVMDDDIATELTESGEIIMTAPEKEGTYTGRYDIQDRRGEIAYGDIRLVVSEDAPLLAPIARDDTAPMSALVDRDWVEVDVLANDYDPDGGRGQLSIEVPGYGASEDESARVTPEGKLSIPVLERMQQIRYVLVDGDGNRANGMVTVPGRQDSVPVLKDPATELTATAGQPLSIDIGQLVAGTEGRDVKLTRGDNVTATQGRAQAAGEAKVEYLPDAAYQGPASVVFEVSDKVLTDGDTSAKTAFISIPVKVLPAGSGDGKSADDLPVMNLPPVLVVESPTLRVGPDEGEARLDLVSLFRDPEGDSTFVKGDLSEGAGDARISWRLEGDRLVASAPLGAQPGTYRELNGTVMDAFDNEQRFTVRVQVISSTRPLVTTVVDTAKGVAGQPVVVHPLQNDSSNLVSDKTLTLVGARLLSGPADLSFDVGSGSVTITPQAGWHGPVTASYTVNDANNDPDRRVDGTIRIEVQDKPGRPSTPFEGVAGDGQVSVKYLSTGDGGSEIVSRVATATSPGQPDRQAACGVGVCTVTGLRNGIPWTVSVVETNAIGASEPSPTSAGIVPDAVPLPPSAPVVQFGDRQLTASWTHEPKYASQYGGSPIESYLLTLHDAGGAALGEPVTLPASTMSYTWQGLENGRTYLFSVQAKNSNDRQSLISPRSAFSVPEHPTGVPQGNISVTAKAIDNEIGGGFSVSFDSGSVNANGDAVSHYTVTPVTRSGGERGGSAVRVEAGGGAAEIHGMGQEPTRFVVRAVNRAGAAVVGESGDFIVAYALPKINAVDVTPGNGRLTVSVSTNIPAGSPGFVEYRLGGDWRRLSGDGVIGGLENGRSYTLQLRAQIEHMTSATETRANVMPRSDVPATPRWEDASNFRLVLTTRDSDIRVRASIQEMSYQDTGGWDPAGYIYCATTRSGSCSGYGPDRTRQLVPGQYNYLHWGYSGGPSGEGAGLDLTAVSVPTLGGDNIVRFTLPYVVSGGCQIHFSRGGVAGTPISVSVAGGQLRAESSVMVPVPVGESTELRPPDDVYVECVANDSSRRWNLR